MKEKTRSAAIVSGGSSASVSLTPWSSTVTVQVSPTAKSVTGSSVYAASAPESANAWAPLVAHEIENDAADTVTGSLNVMPTFAVVATAVAPAAGVVLATDGALSGAGPAVTEMSSTPTHSSLPVALLVMTRSWTSGWLSAAAGRRDAHRRHEGRRLGPAVASAT